MAFNKNLINFNFPPILTIISGCIRFIVLLWLSIPSGLALDAVKVGANFTSESPTDNKLSYLTDPQNSPYRDIDYRHFNSLTTVKERIDYITSYFNDITKNALSIREILLEHRDDFKTRRESNLGMLGRGIWYQFRVENSTNSLRKLILTYDGMLAHTKTYLVTADDEITPLQSTGVLYPVSHRHMYDVGNQLNQEISLPPKEEVTIFIYTYTLPGAINTFKVNLSTNDFHYQQTSWWLVLQALYYGAVLALGLYNLFLFLSTKDTIYAYYVLHLVFFVGLLSVLNGTYAWLFPETTISVGKLFTKTSFAGTLLFMTLFSRAFLELQKLKRIDLMWRSFALLIGIQYIISFFIPFHLAIYGFVASNFILFPSIIFVVIRQAIHGKREAHWFLIAFSVFILSALVQSLLAVGFLDHKLIYAYAIQIGSFLEVILLSMALGFRLRLLNFEVIEGLKKLSDLQKLNADIRIKTLNKQVSPHFLFNSLALISDQLGSEQHPAKESIQVLADLYRQILIGAKKITWPMENELDIVSQYLYLQKLRFNERLNYDISAPESIEEVHCPCLVIQTLVENAVKHGIMRIREGGSIHIKIEQEKDVYSIEVSNTAPDGESDLSLSPSVVGTGTGLENSNQRLSRLYGKDSCISLNTSNGVTTARFFISGKAYKEA